MPTRLLPIDLLTASYRIVGQLEVSSGAVLGILSDPTSSFMEIHDANLARIHLATRLVEQAALVRVVKQQVTAICLARREDVGPYSGLRSGYTRILKHPLRITTSTYEFNGTLDWPGRFDFVAIMSEGASDFFPIFDATLGAILFPSLLIQSPAMLINRKHVNTLVQMGKGSDQDAR